MKTIVAFAALFAVAVALPQRRAVGNPAEVLVVKETPHNNIGVEGYQYSYELSDGTKREEVAQVEQARSANEEATLRVQGSFSFVAADGQTYTVNYVADETGFHPEGAHLPVAPVA